MRARERGGIVRIGLGVGVAVWLSTLVLQPGLVLRPGLAAQVVVTSLLIATVYAAAVVLGAHRAVAWTAVLTIGLVGIGLRLMVAGDLQSDVLIVTRAAVTEWLSGGVPYGIGYAVTTPPGEPFPYGPVALAWYALAGAATQQFELAVGCFVVAVFVLRGRPVGAAAYALMPLVATAAVDGSNDTSAGLFLLVALLGLGLSRFAGGVLLAIAVGFKLFAAAWLPPALAIGGWRVLSGFGLGAALAWGPAALSWGLQPIVAGLGRALDIHAHPSYSLAALIEALTGRVVRPDLFRLLGPLAGAVVAAALFVAARFRRVDVALAGLAIFVVTLYSGFWATHAYAVMVAPIICWELDRWLGTERWTVRWPLSPLRRVAERLAGLRLGPERQAALAAPAERAATAEAPSS